MDWEEYEEKCEEIRKENKRYLEIFEKDLEGLSPKTVRNHLDNVEFYINEYLLREDALRMNEGITQIDNYLGYFFIRKCMWSTPATVKSTAASIKKFYKCMKDNGYIEGDEYGYLCSVIKDNMELWQEDCAAFNDPGADDLCDFW